ncbi:hypothetical protein ACFQZ1_08515 [Bacillus sp. CGMCC 1.60114]|uniref:hypothetical protein n=1 Tax=unclassified Bacillus (in: firmicutes) TaxID=185979 RepID=UPI00363564D8
MILDGKRLTGQAELQDALKALLEKPKFNEIVESLQKVVKFGKDELEMKLVYIFDTRSYLDGALTTGKITVVRAAERIQIRHIVLTEKNGKVVGEDYTIDTINEKGGLTVFGYNKELEEVASSTHGGYEFLETSVNEELIDNKEFAPFSTVKEEGWGIPFCLAGGYKHCGPGCGDGLTFGGGTPINAIDYCCRSHDRCWSQFGENDACCDKNLVSCAKANRSAGPVASDLIVAWFSSNANKC